MNVYKTINSKKQIEIEIEKPNTFKGESIEQKCARVTETNAPIEAISPMIYTERKDGVKPEYDIRADKWDIAQQAMTTIAMGHRQKRQERMDKPVTNSETSVTNE